VDGKDLRAAPVAGRRQGAVGELRYGLGREFLETYDEKISAVTAADVQRFAKERIRPDRMSIVLVGNASAFIDSLKKTFGNTANAADIEVIPAGELDLLREDLRKPKAAQAAPHYLFRCQSS
jgi:zinc protease